MERTYDLPLRWPSRRTAIVLALVAVLGGVAISGVLWLRSYAPLEWGGTESYVWPVPHPGGRMSVGLDLDNNGSFPVRVERVIPDDSPLSPFKAVGLRVQRPSVDEGVFPDRTSQAPFTLSPHQSRFVFVDYRIASCAAAKLDQGTYATLGAVRLRYSYAGFFKRSQWIHLPRHPRLHC